MHKSKIKQISLAVCLAFMPVIGYTAGLGKLNVNSGLGEPLKAEIELLSVTPDELSSLTAAIASEEAYAVQGIARLGVHSTIKVELAKNTNGAPVLRVHSNQPINDPYLDMLIQVDWASGRLLREYTLLLDPPEYKPVAEQAAPVKITPAKTTTSENSASSVSSQNLTQTSRSQNPASDNNGELITVKGDTLSSVAKELQVDGVSLDQMLIGLYESNKQAFANNNINQLKVGQIIKAPSKDTLAAIDIKEAKKTIKAHASNWNAYRNALADTVQSAPVAEESEQKQSAGGKITTAEDKAAAVKSGAQDIVKLSAGAKEAAASGTAGSAEYDAKILALQEEATAREKALKDAQERTNALEKQIEDMQKLLALKNQTMTDLQKNAAEVLESPAAETSTETAPAQSADDVTKATEEVKAQPPKKTPPAAQVAEPEAEPSFLDSVFDNLELPIVAGSSALVLLLAGWLFLRNKRKKDLDSFERGILTSGGLRANTVFGNTTGNSSNSDTSFLTDFAQSADGSMIDTNDVDPIAEAEVYMAYGRDAQAEEILKDAIVKEPKRYELHLKLLEMYAGRKDISAFEAIAGELYTTLGAEHETWAKVAALGIELEPDNPLYNLSNTPLPLAAEEASKLDISDFANVALAKDDALDFSLGDDLAEPEEKIEDAHSVITDSFGASESVESDSVFDLDVAENEAVAESVVEPLVSGVSIDAQTDEVANSNSGSNHEEALEFTLGGLADDTPITATSIEAGDSEDLGASTPAFSDTAPALNFNLASDFSNDTSGDASELGTDAGNALETVSAETLDEQQAKIADALSIDFPSDDLGVDHAELEQSSATTELNAENTLASLALPSLDLDSTESATAEPVAVEAISKVEQAFESLGDSNVTDEISFDLPLAQEDEVPVLEMSASDKAEANAFDFSSISLDLGDNGAEALAEEVAEDVAIDIGSTAVPENQDVDIKLDLVAAYIDMDDKEGARELLEEVLKEGGPQQRLKAEQLIASLA